MRRRAFVHRVMPRAHISLAPLTLSSKIRACTNAQGEREHDDDRVCAGLDRAAG